LRILLDEVLFGVEDEETSRLAEPGSLPDGRKKLRRIPPTGGQQGRRAGYWHWPMTQTRVTPHVRPQYPQLLGSVLRFVSQPFVRMFMSQSPQPAVHVPMQFPPVQTGKSTWFVEQGRPQPPQLFGSLVVFVSQPFVCLFPSQSPQPAAHAPVQIPEVQVREITWFDEQTRPHPPQLSGLLAISISQPFVTLSASQSPHPASHEPLQTPAEQVRTGTWFDEQIITQAPQLSGSFERLVSHPFACIIPSQLPHPAAHAPVQLPPVHALTCTWFVEHASPHAPQLSGSPEVLVSHPSASLFALQSPHPGAHAPVQTPAAHVLTGT
jgi:hypothetical protein